eukprot:CAMPEP_0118911678 /NCGR_PEP_ID=MMETSP1166-20130328/13268_1 /TAXON_ID=1104430 /ORGANISM="Chrysoreinhardia sp, Strain CCMP3193" /LENGTH=98 /DNA_ID=CAMNT_0006851175 /DNA_START=41 /DNA_END=337 /DNA_ORIENTATION=-
MSVDSLEAQKRDLSLRLAAAEDRATRVEAEAQEMYETANAQLQKSLESAQERIAQLERENGTLALTIASLRARHDDDLTVNPPPFSPLTTATATPDDE